MVLLLVDLGVVVVDVSFEAASVLALVSAALVFVSVFVELVRGFALVVTLAWLVEEFVLVVVVVVLHFLLHLLFDVPGEPVLGAIAFVGLIHDIFVLVANVLDHKVFAFKYFLADFALIPFSLDDLFAFVVQVVFHVSLDELLLRVLQLSGTLFDSFEGHVSILLHKYYASLPLQILRGLESCDLFNREF